MLRSLSKASVSVGLPRRTPAPSPATALPGPDIAESSGRRDPSTHRRNIVMGKKWPRRRRRKRAKRRRRVGVPRRYQSRDCRPWSETGCRYGIAEDVMRPVHRGGGRHRHIARNQPKIAALTRAKHQAVRPKAYQLTVAIGCPVMDPERDQRKLHHEWRCGRR